MAENKPAGEYKVDTAELCSNAKVVAGAAQAALHKETDKIEKQKVAGACADLVDAASHYGNLEGKGGLGGNLQKAEDYLRKYESSNPGTAPAAAAPPAEPPKKEEGGGGGFGDVMKMAQGFLK